MWEGIKALFLIIVSIPAFPFMAIYFFLSDTVYNIRSKMLMHNKIKFVTSNLTQLPQRVRTCREVAQTLVETGQKLTRSESVWKFIAPTEYDRARKRIISTCQATASELKSIRKKALSVDAIRAAPAIKNVIYCCENCLAENQKNIALGQPFRCQLVKVQLDNPVSNFRFILDKKGQIIEQN